MAYGLEEFCTDCRDALTADGGDGGRETIRRNLEKLLKNRDFVAANCGPDAETGVHTLYHDDGSVDGKGDLSVAKQYRIDPGMAGVFHPGDIHSIDFPDGARFVRVTGTDLKLVGQSRFDLEAGTVATADPMPRSA